MRHIITFFQSKHFFIVIFFLAIGCHNVQHSDSNKSYSEPLKYVLDYYQMENDFPYWELDKAITQDSGIIVGVNDSYSGGYFYFTRIENDTLSWLAFEFYTSKTDTVFSPIELYKRYENRFYQYVLLLGKNSDTLFYYKAPLIRDLHKIFISGKYYYQYLFNELNSNQRDYFLHHKDSLTKIKGDSVIQLPES